MPARPSGSSPISPQVITCSNGVTVVISSHRNGGGLAYFREACATCALRPQCTKATGGRNIGINAYEEALARARLRRVDPAWRDEYRSTRPKVERKPLTSCGAAVIGRRAQVRGTMRVDADFKLLAVAVNPARLGTLRMRSSHRSVGRLALWKVSISRISPRSATARGSAGA